MRVGALPEGRRGAALALGLLAIVLAFVWVGAAAPLIGWYQARAVELARQRALAAHMQATVATLPATRAAAKRARGQPAADALLLGNSDAIAAASLQGTIEVIARGAGANLTSIAILPGEPAGAWRRIGLRLEVRAPFAVIVRFLEAVSRGAPPMLIDDLSLTGSAISAPGARETIAASLTVYAFRGANIPPATPDERQAFAE
jgi:hypothetical protein